MFTGIIEAQGTVTKATPQSLSIQVAALPEPWQLGESIAVDGCCLTLVASENGLRFEMSEETLRKTALGQLQPGSKVNIERSMQANGRFGGHIVQGHVDTTGIFVSVRDTEQAHVMRFSYPAEFGKYLIVKGSISVNGISLTAVAVTKAEFEIWIIPHTWANTNLSGLKPGQWVNLEFDMIAKYVERLMNSHSETSAAGRANEGFC